MEIIVENFDLPKLRARIQAYKDRGYDTTKVFDTISHNWIYGTFKIKGLLSLGHLRIIINETYHGVIISDCLTAGKPQIALF